jgi:hypothetical protein
MSADDMRAAAEKTGTSARPAGSSRTDRVSVSVSIARRHFARKRAPVDKRRRRYRASRLGLYRPGQAALLGSPEGVGDLAATKRNRIAVLQFVSCD